jgi:diguanylate cyclase (GGDEF)-like protein/PAS domain S-box-containing protein
MALKRIPRIDILTARIVGAYLALGVLWIIFSDTMLTAMVSDVQELGHFSLYKGVAFMVVTALLLYLLVRQTLAQQSRLEQSLAISEERWKFALEGAGEGVWDWNLLTDEVFRSGQWHTIYGYSLEEVGSTATEGRQLMHPTDVERAVAEMLDYLEGRSESFISEFRLRCKNGEWKWTLSRGMIVNRDASGRPTRMIGTHTDISERKNNEAEIFRLAHYDKVTGLPNRVLFQDRLQQDIEQANRSEHALTLMFLDLDRFKEVNDTLGHDMGDLLLQQAAKRLLQCVRASDTVARLGGDEFTIILTHQSNLGSVEHVAQQVLSHLSQPFQLGDELIYISASVGITVYPEDATDAEMLLKNADQAMYAAKEQGRNCFHFFTSSMQQASVERMRIAADLHTAVEEDQFELLYQPIIDMASGRIHKAEGLIRWQHPTRGMVSPVEFIGIAEDKGLIVDIGDEVFIKATDQVQRWRRTIPDFQVSINKSPIQLKTNRTNHMDWIDHLRVLGLPGDAIVIEITEGVLLDAQNRVTSRLENLRDAGVQIAIDDFGTGYSSLAYINKFDINFVKIDQSFTRGLKHGARDLALCEAIIVMSHKLGMKVIAEGVETQLQHDLLAEAGCDYGQGYFYSKPLAVADFDRLLEANRSIERER